MLHTGIDLHKRDLTATTVDAAGQVVRTARRRTTRAAGTGYFAERGADVEHRAVVESTSTWYWLADHWRDQHIGLTLGHSTYVKAIRDATGKTDAVDAATLAQLLRSDLIPAAHMISPALREPRDLRRQRLVLVAKRTRGTNAVAGLLAQYTVATPDELPALPRFQCGLHAEQRVRLTAQIKRLERQLLPTLIPDVDVQRLLWGPGIGKVAAFTRHLEIDGIARVADVRRVCSSCRLVPGAKHSGGKSRHGARERADQGRQPLPEAGLPPRRGARDSVQACTTRRSRRGTGSSSARRAR